MSNVANKLFKDKRTTIKIGRERGDYKSIRIFP